MKILFGGDSYSWGAFLQNREDKFTTTTAKHFNAEERNVGGNGFSNEKILLKITETLYRESSFDFVCVQLSDIFRMAVVTSKGIQTLNPNGAKEPGKLTFIAKWLHTAGANYPYEWYRISRYKVFLLENYLNSLNIPHVFVFKGKDNKFYNNDPEMKDIVEKSFIQKSIFEYATENNFPLCERGTHPLKEGHDFFAKEVLIPEIEKRLSWK
jgi:hypothetical protein